MSGSSSTTSTRVAMTSPSYQRWDLATLQTAEGTMLKAKSPDGQPPL